jgi:GT2 family glycosyltransferase
MMREISEMNDRSESGSGRLVRGGGFDFRDTADGLFFVHDGGRRVRTDALGRAVWLNLPGERRAVLEKVRETPAVPEMMAGDFLDIMIAAGIVAEAPGNAPDSGSGGREDAGKTGAVVGSLKTRGVRKTDDLGVTPSGGCEIRPDDAEPGTEDAGIAEEPGPVRGGLVSAVVVASPGLSDLRACLGSLRRQTWRDIEIVVVATAGPDADGASEIAAREAPGARIVAVRERLSRSARINRGVRESRGNFLFILSGLVEADPACIESLRTRLAGDSRAAAAVPVVRFSDLKAFVKSVGKHIQGKGGPRDNYSGAVDLGGFDAAGDLPAADFDAVLVRRSVWEDAGPADKTMAGGCDDLEWSFRARLLGRRIAASGGAVVYNKRGEMRMTESEALRRIARGRLGLALKLFRGRTPYDYLVSFVKEDAKAFLSRAARGEGVVALAFPRAYAGLLLSLPGILWRRAAAMRRRDRGFESADLPGPAEGYPILTDDEGHPLLDANAYFRHYFWEFARTRRNTGKMPAGADARCEE